MTRYAFPSLAALCGFTAMQAHADVITNDVIDITAFSGDETVISFNEQFSETMSRTIGDVTIETLTAGSGMLVNNGDYGVFFSNIPQALGGQAAVIDGALHEFQITFNTAVNRAGFLLSALPVFTWEVAAFDVNGAQLGGDLLVTTPDEHQGVFAGFEFETPIARLYVTQITSTSAATTVLDDIRFEAVTTVPEPAALALLAVGGLAMVGGRSPIRR